MLFKIELPPTLNSYYYKNNNNNKYKQGSMNISEDITIKTNIKQKYKNIGVIAEYPAQPFTCVGMLWRTRYITIVATLI